MGNVLPNEPHAALGNVNELIGEVRQTSAALALTNEPGAVPDVVRAPNEVARIIRLEKRFAVFKTVCCVAHDVNIRAAALVRKCKR
jgi:hypothetical protein